jgi:YD repeat-containing protein
LTFKAPFEIFKPAAATMTLFNSARDIPYERGVLSQVVTPRYAPNASLTRMINPEGTVGSETRFQTFPSSGFTTTFQYDNSFRQTSKAPPVGNGNAFVTSYDNLAGTSVTVTRGPNSMGLKSILTTNLDGFGRVSNTTNNVGVQTKVTYDACGRRCAEPH